ncbi:hypothetical protein [Gracilibacillus kekensis]|uniref:Uncharacterized protein n=1 Tax=Gracilibacillus kekensis TaxID=1027249 RepID=A0A1M7LFN5_9BACI|nr:hypothetical protein [Gracilibacillus kekensis]SHM76952.1 hypothetical protein SAMN05216179_1062 [Gracilibacillus kekensis]
MTNKPLFVVGVMILIAVLQFGLNVRSGYIFVLAIIGGLSIGASFNKRLISF